MDPVQEAIVFEEIENALRETPSSATWDGVTTLNTTDPRASSWRRYKERLAGASAEQWVTKNYAGELNVQEVGAESLIWKDVSNLLLRTFNSLFPDVKAVDLNDKKCSSVAVDEITKAFIRAIDNDELLENSIFIDVMCDPIIKKLSEKIGEVGKCCTSELLRCKSKSEAINEICGKRTDLGGTTDWVMRRYGGSRRESSMYVTLMWWTSWFMLVTCGNYGVKKAVDCCIGIIPASIIEQVTGSDGDRTTHTIDKTELVDAVKDSADKSLTPAGKVRLGLESVVTSRIAYVKKYNDLYKKVSSTANPKNITPTAFMKARFVDGSCTTALEMLLTSEFGETFNTMNGSIYLYALKTGALYNDLSDAILDMKYKETHNFVIFAKTQSNYSFSDHCEALYVALTTFDEPNINYDIKIKKRMCRYRYANALFYALWPRYRVSERARRYVGALNNEERNKLVQRGRRCIQGDVYIEENIWLDAVCSNYNNRRAVIRNRGYTQTLFYLLGVEEDHSAKDHISSAIKAIGSRPFDTGLELVTTLGSEWLAKFALRTVEGSESYNDLVAELSDLLSTLSSSSLPIISDNTITPCESICGSLCLRLVEILTVVSDINNVAGEAIMSVVSSLITMVSLDPFRCIAYHADMLLLSN